MATAYVNFQHTLEDISNQILSEFLHSCVDHICGKKQQQYDNFKSCTNWTREEYDYACKTFKQILTHVLTSEMPENKILEQYPCLSSSHIQCIIDCLQVRKNDLYKILKKKSHAVSGPTLQDFDWKVKWIMGSSCLSAIREPVLLLDLHTCEEDGRTGTEHFSMELNKNDIRMLLATLEKARDCILNWKIS